MRSAEGPRRPWRAWITVGVLVAVLAVYFVVLGQRAVLLLRTPGVVPFLLGLGVLVLPFVGAWLVLAEVRFGIAADRLATELARDQGRHTDGIADRPTGDDEGAGGAGDRGDGGAADDDSVIRRPSGRVDRRAADTAYIRRKAEVEASPSDWRAWLRLGLAYDDAGDRRRARAAVRRAVALRRSAGV